VTVISLTTGEFWEQPLIALGATVRHAGRRQSRLARVCALTHEVRRRRPAIMQSTHFYTNLYAMAASRAAGIPEIGSVRGDGVMEMRKHGRIWGALGLRLPRTLAVNSQTARERVQSYGVPAYRVRLLRNVVDTDAFLPVSEVAERDIDVLGIGRLSNEKRFDRFLRVVARAARCQGRKLRAVIAGSGPLRSKLEQHADRLGIGNSLRFMGPTRDVATLYARSKMLLLTSDHEGTPNVVLEAMACGTPVVATNAGDTACLVPHGECGFVTTGDDEAALGDFTRILVHDAGLRGRLGQNARAHVVEKYSVACLPERLGELYGTALA